MKREQKETAEQYLERIPSFAKKKSGMEAVSYTHLTLPTIA